MAFDSFKKAVQNIASTTVKKTGEQAQITKLALDKSKLEKEIESVYTTIGRRCYTLSRTADPVDSEIASACDKIDDLMAQIATLEDEIKLHKLERDSAQYQLRFDDEDDGGVDVEITVEKNEDPNAAKGIGFNIEKLPDEEPAAEEAPAEEAPAEDAPVEEAPAEEETPAE